MHKCGRPAATPRAAAPARPPRSSSASSRRAPRCRCTCQSWASQRPTQAPPSPAKPPCAAPTSTPAPATRAPTRTGAARGDFTLLARRAAAALLAALAATAPPSAHAVLNSPNARVARTADAALRRSVPAVNAAVRGVQDALESVAFSLRIPQRKPWADMAAAVDNAAAVMGREDALNGAPDREAAAQIAASVRDGLVGVRGAIDARDADVTARRLAAVLADVARLEVAQAPGLPYALPRDVAALPRLTGRATVELTLARGSRASPLFQPADGAPADRATLQVTVDGYSAPITAGAFVSNAAAGLYDGARVSRSATALLAGAGVRPDATLPLEVLPAGAFEPVYKAPLEVGSGEMPALPLSVYGAVAMARPPGAPLSESSAGEFFVFLFNRQQAGLGGLAFEEGEFSVLGYVTKGAALLDQIADGDTIARARVVEGGERLVVPGAAAE